MSGLRTGKELHEIAVSKAAARLAEMIDNEVMKEFGIDPELECDEERMKDLYSIPVHLGTAGRVETAEVKEEFIHIFGAGIKKALEVADKIILEVLKEKSERPDTDKESLHHFSEKYLRPFMQQKIKNMDKMTITCGKCGSVIHATEEDWKEANRIKCDGCGRIEPLTPEIKARLQERG